MINKLLAAFVAAVCLCASSATAAPEWKRLADYPRPPAPDTGWGIHDHTDGIWVPEDPDFFFRELKERYGFSWYKVLALGDNKLEVVRAARRQGVEPVVRIYKSSALPWYPREGAESEEFTQLVRQYVEAGANYFEFANEPNLDLEWASEYHDKTEAEKIELMCRHWLRVRPLVDAAGGIPLFYAMTPGSAGRWYKESFELFAKWDKIDEAFAGAGIAGHFCSLNHPIDYPFDPQKNMPHSTRQERFESLMRDNSCYRLVELVTMLAEQYLPQPIPILSTEGGTGLHDSQDSDYPPLNPALHAEMNMEIFRRFNPKHVDYWGDAFFAQMSWNYGGSGAFGHSVWFDNPEYGGDLPVLAAMERETRFDRSSAYPPLERSVAAPLEQLKHPTSAPPEPWIPLWDYPRPAAPDTGWGIHDRTNCSSIVNSDFDGFFRDLKQRYGFSWFKVLACGGGKEEMVAAARRQGVEPVVRLYAFEPHPYFPRPGAEEEEFRRNVRNYVAAGARYFESGNEPNLGLEWTAEEFDKPNAVERLCRQWLRVKKVIQDEGGIPVFYAMTPGSAGQWWKDCFVTFERWGKTEEAFAGAAYGVHLGPINHPLDYPFNPQKDMPRANGQQRYESLLKDNTNYLAVELLQRLMARYLPHPIPILSTEGGAFLGNQDDGNYPPVTLERHTEMNMGIFNRFNPEHPEYWGDSLFTQMSWEYDSWFHEWQYGKLPILDAMEEADKFDRGVAFKDSSAK